MALGYLNTYAKTESREELFTADEKYMQLDKLMLDIPVFNLIHSYSDILFEVRNDSSQLSIFDLEEFKNFGKNSKSKYAESESERLYEYMDIIVKAFLVC